MPFLPPETPQLEQLLQERLQLYKQLYKKVTAQTQKLPSGNLKVVKNHNSAQYYRVSQEPELISYISKKDTFLIEALAQKAYNKKLLKSLQHHISWLNRVLDTMPARLSALYEKLTPERKPLVIPEPLPFDQYKKQWLARKYEKNSFPFASTAYQTKKGETVRSKSELIIADALTDSDIPYRYEFPVFLTIHEKSQLVHPDFYCLAPDGTEVIWEHFGLIHDPEYAENFLAKYNAYVQNGWQPGKNFIMTFETENNPLHTSLVKKIIHSNF